MKLPSFLLLSLSLPLFTVAQPAIKGRVVDAKGGKPLAYATVVCYDGVKAVRAVTSGREGYFSLLAGDRPEYRVVATMVGYAADTIRVAMTPEGVDLGEVKLHEGVAIGVVEIEGQKPLFEQQIDRYVYNVANDPDAKRIKMSEMMEKVPLLEINPKGKLTYLGKDDVQIIVDGERHELLNGSKQYVMNFLRADVMGQIEIIPPGSPEYNNDKPIVNIRTARRIPNGFALEVTGSGNTENSWGAGVDFVSKIADRVIVGLGYTMAYADKPDLHTILRRETFSGDDVTDIQETRSKSGFDNNLHIFNLRASTKVLGNNLRVGVRTSLGESNTRGLSGMVRTDGDGSPKEDQQTNTRLANKTRPRLNGDVAYSHKLGGGYWAYYDYAYSDSRSEADNRSKTLFSGDRDMQERLAASMTGIREHGARMSVRYNVPGGKVKPHRFFGNLSYTDRKYSNVVERTRWDALAMDYVPDYSFNNGMEYTQRVAGLNTGYWLFLKGVSAQAGVAATYENSRGVFSDRGGASFNYEKLNLLPRVSMNYRFNRKWSVSMGYDMRITRPDFTMLNPYVDDADSMNLRTGNPRLEPERSHNVRLGTSRIFVAGRRGIWFDLLYSHIDRAVEQVVTVDAVSGISTSTYDNVGKRNNLTAKLTLWGIVAGKWCNLSGVAAYDYVSYDSSYAGSRSNGSQHAVSTEVMLNIRLWKGARIGGSYTLRSDIGSPQNGRVTYSHWFNFDFSQTLVKNRLFLGLTLDNPFDSHRYMARSLVGENFRSLTRSERRGRIFGFSLRANFGRFRDRVAEGGALDDDRSRATIPEHKL